MGLTLNVKISVKRRPLKYLRFKLLNFLLHILYLTILNSANKLSCTSEENFISGSFFTCSLLSIMLRIKTCCESARFGAIVNRWWSRVRGKKRRERSNRRQMWLIFCILYERVLYSRRPVTTLTSPWCRLGTCKYLAVGYFTELRRVNTGQHLSAGQGCGWSGVCCPSPPTSNKGKI